jgi:hypothetical protein
MPFRKEPPHTHGSPASTAVVLVNLGTPDAPDARALRRYLKQFLSDPRVVEIPRRCGGSSSTASSCRSAPASRPRSTPASGPRKARRCACIPRARRWRWGRSWLGAAIIN